MEVAEFTFVLL